MPERKRIVYVDGMRGIAALFVVIYHLSGAAKEQLEKILPDIVLSSFSFGFVGVPIFFVISGLVISTSLSRKIDGRFAGLFIVRRSLRLDPTYWAAIVVALTTESLKAWVLKTPLDLPSLSEIGLHMVYLQDLAQVKEPISVVYWTLCLEVQFYLFFLFSKWLCEQLASHFDASATNPLLITLGLVAAWSLVIDHNLAEQPLPGLFLPYWHYFYAGVLFACASNGHKQSLYGLVIWLISIGLIWMVVEIKAYTVAALCTLLVFWAAANIRWVASLLETRSIVFLGMISYSLYLIHPDVGWKSISLAKHIAGDGFSGWLALLAFIGAIVVSIVAAYLLYLLVERPSLKLVDRVKKLGVRGLMPLAIVAQPMMPGSGKR